MPARPLRWFDPPKPLLERFGRDFFRAVPATPGVYIMSGETDRVLYVGQSGNLRVRLGSYRNAHPDRAPRKLIRLVHAVRKIVWQQCESAAQALLLENELLRTHRPKFNKVNTYPAAYCFLGFKAASRELLLCLRREEAFDGELYGAFKSRSVQAFSALLRLLWAAQHQPYSLDDFPRQLVVARAPRSYSFSMQSGCFEETGWIEALAAFLQGTSPTLIGLLTSALPPADKISPFQRALQETDLATLTDFFEYGPRRNHDLKTWHDLPGVLIPQNRLDDLLALAKGGHGRLPGSLTCCRRKINQG
jgi:hypothetical protein